MTKQISNGVNKTTVIGIVIAIIVFGGIVLAARPDSQTDTTTPLPSTSNGNLEAEEMSFDFGTISMKDGDVSHTFKIENIGDEPVVIEKMYTSCMCTTATLILDGRKFGPYGMPGHGFMPKINKTIDAGEEAAVLVVFDPAAHGPAGIGRIERAIIIENNAGVPLELGFAAMVTP